MAVAYNTNLTFTADLRLSWSFINDLANAPTRDENRLVYKKQLLDGQAVNQSEEMWHDRRSVATGGNDDIDLAGVLENVFGRTINFETIRAIIVINRSSYVGDDITIGGAGAGNNAIADLMNGSQDAELTVKAGGCVTLNAPLDGYDVVGGSEDVLRISHAGVSSSISYDVVLVGTVVDESSSSSNSSSSQSSSSSNSSSSSSSPSSNSSSSSSSSP